MIRVLLQKLPVFILGVFLALGMVLSAMHASDLAITIGAGSGLCLSGQTNDTGCHAQTTLSSCESICTVTTIAVLPDVPESDVARSADTKPPRQRAAGGVSLSPDPFPPRG